MKQLNLEQEERLIKALQRQYPGLESSYTMKNGTILKVTDYYLSAAKEQNERLYSLESIFGFDLARALLQGYKKDLDNSIDYLDIENFHTKHSLHINQNFDQDINISELNLKWIRESAVNSIILDKLDEIKEALTKYFTEKFIGAEEAISSIKESFSYIKIGMQQSLVDMKLLLQKINGIKTPMEGKELEIDHLLASLNLVREEPPFDILKTPHNKELQEFIKLYREGGFPKSTLLDFIIGTREEFISILPEAESFCKSLLAEYRATSASQSQTTTSWTSNLAAKQEEEKKQTCHSK